jgi:katanin p60 ATPase-containing subunit A1
MLMHLACSSSHYQGFAQAMAEGILMGRVSMQGVEVADDCDFDNLSKLGEGYSGDDITNICRDAAMNGLRRAIEGKDMSQIKAMHQDDMHEPIRMQDFQQAFAKIKPSVGKDDLEKHEKWREEFGST